MGNLDVVGDKVVVAHGGAGGGPGNGWIGQPGESLHIRLDLRVSENPFSTTLVNKNLIRYIDIGISAPVLSYNYYHSFIAYC